MIGALDSLRVGILLAVVVIFIVVLFLIKRVKRSRKKREVLRSRGFSRRNNQKHLMEFEL